MSSVGQTLLAPEATITIIDKNRYFKQHERRRCKITSFGFVLGRNSGRQLNKACPPVRFRVDAVLHVIYVKVTEHPGKPFHEICYRPRNFCSICLKFAPNVVKYVKDTIVL